MLVLIDLAIIAIYLAIGGFLLELTKKAFPIKQRSPFYNREANTFGDFVADFAWLFVLFWVFFFPVAVGLYIAQIMLPKKEKEKPDDQA